MTGFFLLSRRKDYQFAKLPNTSTETNPTFSANLSANSKDYSPSNLKSGRLMHVVKRQFISSGFLIVKGIKLP